MFQLRTLIYIPLWCYFNSSINVKSLRSNNSFTFHYGATSMNDSTISLNDIEVFTFHYGATSMIKVNALGLEPSIYIPLWCYFNKINLIIKLLI